MNSPSSSGADVVSHAVSTLRGTVRAWSALLLALQLAWAGAVAAEAAMQQAVRVSALGVVVADIPSSLLQRPGTPHGVVITNIIAGGAAEETGLRPDDVIYLLNGLPVDSTERLQWLIERSSGASTYRLSVLRDGNPFDVEIAPPGHRPTAR